MSPTERAEEYEIERACHPAGSGMDKEIRLQQVKEQRGRVMKEIARLTRINEDLWGIQYQLQCELHVAEHGITRPNPL